MMALPMTGTFRHNIDGKGRVFLPAKHRDAIGASALIIYPSLHDTSLKYRTVEDWASVEAQIEALPTIDRENASRYFYEMSDTLVTDSQGRIIINQDLAEFAGIKQEEGVVIVGCGKYGEIWSTAAYEQMKARRNVDELRMRLASFGM